MVLPWYSSGGSGGGRAGRKKSSDRRLSAQLLTPFENWVPNSSKLHPPSPAKGTLHRLAVKGPTGAHGTLTRLHATDTQLVCIVGRAGGHRDRRVSETPHSLSTMSETASGGMEGDRSPNRTQLAKPRPPSLGELSPGESQNLSPRNTPCHSPHPSPWNSPMLLRKLMVTRNIGQQRRFTLAHTPREKRSFHVEVVGKG
ncbi:hypothetical protein JZ751_014237 [Albula glossodonta]|uniref:Uncharacterized protein n=1 Tax=Albula glossodonta TaxID=121402 RepID=A0A8T2NUS5_9TELE|nr:hypothetical protein JZ751_014237 [Albula glossodonta]